MAKQNYDPAVIELLSGHTVIEIATRHDDSALATGAIPATTTTA